MSKKYAKKDKISKRESYRAAKLCRDCVADLNDLAYNLSQFLKIGEKEAEKKEMMDSVQAIHADLFGGYPIDKDEFKSIMELAYSAIDGFMSSIEGSGLTTVTKRTNVIEFGGMVKNISNKKGFEEFSIAIKDWANKWYAQHEDDIEEL